MLSTVTASRKATRSSADTTISKMEIQQRHAESTKADRENIARRQRLSEDAHIKRNRDKVAHQHRTAHINNQFQRRSTETDRVGDKVDKRARKKANDTQKQIAARINIAANKTWRKAHTLRENSEAASNTTSSLSSSRGKSSPETDQTSHHGSDDGKTAQKLSKMLMMLDGEYIMLQDKLGSAKQQSSMKDAQYQALEQKYVAQREQRIKDKQLVDACSEEIAAMELEYDELKSANQLLENRLAGATEEHQVEIEAKDRETATLKADHKLVIEAKDAETEKWRETCQHKDSVFQKTVTKLTAERDDIKHKANAEKRKIWKTSRTKTDDLKAKVEALETKHKRSVCDYNDAITKNKETITSLVARNQQLELDTLQIIEKDCTRHREAEQDMQGALSRAHDTTQLLEDRLALSKIQICDAAKQLEQVQQGAVPVGTHCAALDPIELENEQLRNSLQAEREKKLEMQAKFDKLDSENLSLSIEYDIIDIELIEHKKSSSTLRDSTEASMLELRMLRKVAQSQQGILSTQDHCDLLELVSRINEENKGLVEATARLEEKSQKIEHWGKTIKDKCESEMMKANHNCYTWYLAYFDEAVATTERLHAEIAALKVETGEQHFVEPTPPANQAVYDRKMLPFAMAHGLQGVSAHLVPSAVHDVKFGTCVPATEDAVKTLRPQGWYPVYTAGKVWLSKVVEPFSEEEAAMQIHTGGHHASLSSAGSGESAMSNIYAPRDTDIPTNSGVYNKLPVDYSDLQTAFLTHSSSKRAHNPIAPKRDNQAAAERDAARPTTMQAPKPEPKPQAARRIAQTSLIEAPQVPEYRSAWQQIDKRMTREAWEDCDPDLKVKWVEMNVKTDED